MSVKKCKNNEILDIITNRCNTVGGVSFLKKLKEQTEKKIIHFKDEDLVKLGYNVKTAKIPEKTKIKIKKHVETSEPIIDISDKVKETLKKKIKNFKDTKQHINQEHKDFCNGKKVMLSEPIMVKKVHTKFSYIQTPLKESFNPLMISNVFDKTKFTVHDYYGNQNFVSFKQFSSNYIKNSEFNDDMIDITWFNKLNIYIKNLPHEQLFAVYAYTYHGDNLINMFSRFGKNAPYIKDYVENYTKNLLDAYIKGSYFPLFFPLLKIILKNVNESDNLDEVFLPNVDVNLVQYFLVEGEHDPILKDFSKLKPKDMENIYVSVCRLFPFIKEEIVIQAIKDLMDTLCKAIDGAPPLTKKMLVYRGSRERYFFNKEMPNTLFRNKGFISTTIDFKVANSFTSLDNCCVSYITLLPGTKMLWLEGCSQFQEREFLLSPNTTFFIRGIDKRKEIVDSYPLNVCTNKTNSHIVSDIVAV